MSQDIDDTFDYSIDSFRSPNGLPSPDSKTSSQNEEEFDNENNEPFISSSSRRCNYCGATQTPMWRFL
jgi:hypothetical protein